MVNQSPYVENRTWADQFLPQVKRIIGMYLIEESSDQVDMHEATDLMVLIARDLRIAVRIRRPGYAQRYPYEFTIRARHDSGAKTELAKIVEGWGDWMFYGHADDNEHRLCLWWLIDLNAFRAGLIRQATNGNGIRHGDKDNGDGTWFKWFDIRSFPDYPPLIIASSL